MSQPEARQLPCYALPELFVSTNPIDHRQARRGCSNCPLRDTCKPPAGGNADGTYGGVLYRDGKAIEVRPDRAELAAQERRLLAHLAEMIACPYCGAKVSESCRSAGGNPRVPHTVRVVARLCTCGKPVEARHRMCNQCRKEARKETYRLREIREPTASRRRT